VAAQATVALRRHELPATSAAVARSSKVEGVESARAHAVAEVTDADSRIWLRELRSHGPMRDAAVERLHALLLRAARFEVSRRTLSLPHVHGGELDDLASDAAHDALMSILARLDDFRGASRFTTWAYKFALLEAATKVRKRAWQGREVTLEPESWDFVVAPDAEPAGRAETRELLTAVEDAIRSALTPHQRRVLVAVALNGVPIDVLAERLETTRGALYKTLHDARRKLRDHLQERGLDVTDVEGM
jgi:RNA polymerase sigma-70 factor (ECF subfamily)